MGQDHSNQDLAWWRRVRLDPEQADTRVAGIATASGSAGRRGGCASLWALARNGPERDAAERSIPRRRVVFEGFVSVVPGKLAIGLNHEGGVCVFGV